MTASVAAAPTLVGDLMSRPVLTIDVSESLWDAWQLLFVSGLRHLVVLDDGVCLGVISDRGILTDLPVTADHMAQRKIDDVLPRVPVATIHTTDTAGEAARVMLRVATDALPVLDPDDKLVGIITGSDLARLLADHP
ncbi:MAG: CBS domain-containing protein [Actinomycetes bacterium]